MKRFLLAVGAYLFFTVGAVATPLFGVCATTCTWTAASTAMWSLSSGGATGAGPPGASDTVTLDAATCVGGTTCTITVNLGGPLTIQSLTMGACTASTTGCIFDNSVNNNNITVTNTGNAFNISGAGTRNIKLGLATYTLAGNSTFTMASTSGLTLSAASSTIAFTSTGARTFNYGGGTFTLGTVNIGGTSLPLNNLTVVGTSATTTITAMNISPPNIVYFPNSDTHITTLNCNGTSSAQAMLIGNNQSSATITATAGSIGQWCAVQGIVFTNAATLANGFNIGGNTNLTVTPPGAGGGGGCIINGWLLWKDKPVNLNDNWLEKAA